MSNFKLMHFYILYFLLLNVSVKAISDDGYSCPDLLDDINYAISLLKAQKGPLPNLAHTLAASNESCLSVKSMRYDLSQRLCSNVNRFVSRSVNETNEILQLKEIEICNDFKNINGEKSCIFLEIMLTFCDCS